MTEHIVRARAAAVVLAAAEPGSAGGSEEGRRRIGATLITYDETAMPASTFGTPVRVKAGRLRLPDRISDVKFLRDHDPTAVIGVLESVDGLDNSPYGTFRIARTQAGDEALALAEDGILDAVSVGFRVLDYYEDEGVTEVIDAELFEVSLLSWGAWDAARIDTVSAQKGTLMTTAPTVPSTEPTPAPAPTVTAEPAPAPAPAVPPSAVLAALSPANPQPVTVDGRAIAVRHRNPSKYPGVWGNDGRFYTAGDYFAAFARGAQHGDWSGHQQIVTAVVADQLTSDVPGLLPTPIIGELIGRASGRRPIWDSLAQRDMPMLGATFSRPRITQHVNVGPQTAQKTEVVSRKMTVALDNVSKQTLAGVLDVSQQAIDWTSPSLLNELVIDFTRVYLAITDFQAATFLNNNSTGTPVAWDGTAAGLTTALATAAAQIYSSQGQLVDVLPNTVWVSPDVWVLLAGLSDDTGRPLFPQLGPMNAPGTADLPGIGINAYGFRWVVGKQFPAGTMIMGDSEYAEAYENGRRFLQAVRPDVLGLDIAYMGYTANYTPYPTSFVKFTLPAGLLAVIPAPEGEASDEASDEASEEV